jgi:hypothetical protein
MQFVRWSVTYSASFTSPEQLTNLALCLSLAIMLYPEDGCNIFLRNVRELLCVFVWSQLESSCMLFTCYNSRSWRNMQYIPSKRPWTSLSSSDYNSNLALCLSLAIIFDPEKGCNIFLRNVRELLCVLISSQSSHRCRQLGSSSED